MTDFEKTIEQAWPYSQWRDVTALVAVSGGADSVALLRALQRIRRDSSGKLVVIHVNHHVRDSSDHDQQFVESLADDLNVDCHVRHADIDQTATPGIGREAAMRNARYEFFRNLAHEIGARFIVLAHHREDQVETILHRIFRGTGISGLAGIPKSRTISDLLTLVRPMLSISKQQILEYLRHLKQDYCIDETNFNDDFVRNQIRNRILPRLREQISPDIDQSILRLGQSAEENEAFVNKLTLPLERHVRWLENGFQIERAALLDADRVLVRQLLVRLWQQSGFPLRDMTREKWNSLARLMEADAQGPSKLNLPANIFAWRDDKFLTISR